MTKIIQKEALKIMQSTKKWPTWPVLRLKRGEEIGFLAASEGELTIVFLGSPSELPGRMIGMPSKIQGIKYESFEEILKNGWEIE